MGALDDDAGVLTGTCGEHPKRKRRKKEAERPPVQIYPYEVWLRKLSAVFFPDGQFIEPLSERWRQARRGRLTASLRAETVYKRNPKSWNLMADKIDAELAPDYHWSEVANVAALNWGRDHEPQARANITLEHGRDVRDPGLIFHRQHPFIAATPDGLVIENRKRISIQIKCPYDTKFHLNVLYGKMFDPTYFYQVQWEAWVSRADEIEFYSYDPRQPLPARLARRNIPINTKVLDTFERNALEFAEMYCSGTRMNTGKATPMGVIMPYGG